MKIMVIKSFLFILTAALAVSCAPTVRVNTDYDSTADFTSYKTFSISNLTTTLNVNELNAARIWNAVRGEMAKKGYKENNNNPDLMINVISLLENKKSISATGNGWYRPYWVSGNSTIRAYDYKDGSLLIDVVDVKTNRLIWEGKGSAEITKQPKNPDEVICNAIAKIMNAFPQGTQNNIL